MNEMIERLAKALFESDQELSPNTDIMNRLLYGLPAVTWEYINNKNLVISSISDEYRSKARSLLKVMREPTPELLKFETKSGDLFDWNCNCFYCGGHKFAVQAYIDEALKDE